MTTGIAILGAGIFARSEHLPAVEACSLLSLKAIYSRSKSSADKLAKFASGKVVAYFDAPCSSDRSLDDLLDREDIEAVIIALPITVQPEYIRKALLAGKHVLSEKPIAEDVDTAEKMIQWYKRKHGEKIWSVGENFRFMDHINFGAKQIKELGGEVVTLSVRVNGFMGSDDEYQQTEWRKNPEHQGGILLDAGIHYVAAIRHLLSPTHQHITVLTAFTSLLQPRLAPLDTIHANLQLTNGNSGTFSLSFGAQFKSHFEFQVVTTKGSVTITPSKVNTVKQDPKGPQGKMVVAEHKFNVRFDHSLKNEVETFAKAVKAVATEKRDRRASPEEALEDLRIIQAMLDSGEDGGTVQSLQ